jgi:hypothetical protein
MHTPVPTWVKFDMRRGCRTVTIALGWECTVRERSDPTKRGRHFCIDCSVGIELNVIKSGIQVIPQSRALYNKVRVTQLPTRPFRSQFLIQVTPSRSASLKFVLGLFFRLRLDQVF